MFGSFHYYRRNQNKTKNYLKVFLCSLLFSKHVGLTRAGFVPDCEETNTDISLSGFTEVPLPLFVGVSGSAGLTRRGLTADTTFPN